MAAECLLTNRASGTISVLRVENKSVEPESVVKVCQPADNIADVAVSPDGRLALASLQKAGCLACLKIDDHGVVADTGRRISVYGQPYRCVITPDGALGVTAGSGYGNGVDLDAVSVVDLKATPQTRRRSTIFRSARRPNRSRSVPMASSSPLW